MSRTLRNIYWSSLGMLVGIILGFAVTPLLARTAAIAAPKEIFAASHSPDGLTWRLLAWDILVIHGLAIALPVAIVLFVMFARMPDHRVRTAASVAIGVLLFFYILQPLAEHQALPPVQLHLWQHGLELSLLLASALALGASSVVRWRVRIRLHA